MIRVGLNYDELAQGRLLQIEVRDEEWRRRGWGERAIP